MIRIFTIFIYVHVGIYTAIDTEQVHTSHKQMTKVG